VLVIEFARDALWAGFGSYEFNFAYEISVPGLIDAPAEFAFHALQLLAPTFSVGSNLKATALAANGPRVRGERVPDDRSPRTREPCKGGFRPVDPTHNFSENFSRAVH
jgi:hypothetical protein